MVEQTDLTLPLTPARLGRAVDEIVERAFPTPRQELCMPVGEMVRALTALCGKAVQLAYDDAAGIAKNARERLARYLCLRSVGSNWAAEMSKAWDRGEVDRDRWQAEADELLAVITGQDQP
ncbi:hypothetical protein ACGFIW_01515 [Micromonospora sp. NPDC048935]|uniref:hypothetical protein n=1 Tax=Micromonospora sp. NPDC048935 TaxID=3364262 RepID=UPI003718D70E